MESTSLATVDLKSSINDNITSSIHHQEQVQNSLPFNLSFSILVDQLCEIIENHGELFENVQLFTYVHSFEMIEGDATKKGTPGNQVLVRMRQMKGITSSLELDKYSDKL